MKGLRVIKTVEKIKFEEVWGELESRKRFQRQSFIKYSRLTLVFIWNSAHYGKSLLPVFWDFFAINNQIFNFQRALGYYLMKFRHFPNISLFPKILFPTLFSNSWDNSYIWCSKDRKFLVVRQLVRQFVYTMYISNNPTLCHLLLKENLLKHRRVWKFYENDCLQSFLLLFMSSITAKLFRNSHILIYSNLSF